MTETKYYDLVPAYGRDYGTAQEVTQAFWEGEDFEGDWQMGFKPCSWEDFQKGEVVNLRYQGQTKFVVVKV